MAMIRVFGANTTSMIRVFGANTTYFPSPGLTFAVVECIGGGGGSGGAIATFTGTASPNWIGGGGGGGSGSYSRSLLQAALLVNGVAVTIGAPGAAGTSTSNGGPGGTTSFGALVIANGGFPGDYFNANTNWGYGGHGGFPGSGDLAVTGTSGEMGNGFYWDPAITGQGVWGGLGGAGYLGGTGQQTAILGGFSGFDGSPGVTGSGATGGVSGLNTAPHNGAPGGLGICIVTEYCLGATSLVQPCPDPCNPSPPCPPGGWWTPNW